MLLLKRPVRNLCRSSESFGSVWAAVGTPTITPAAHTAAGISLDLIGDDAGAGSEYYSQAITFTGDAVKAVSVHVKQGTSTSTVIRLRDDTAAAYRLIAVLTWSGGLPVIAMTTGAPYGYDAIDDGVFRIKLATTNITAANTNTLAVHPANISTLADAAATGTIYAGGVQVEDRTRPSRTYRRTA